MEVTSGCLVLFTLTQKPFCKKLVPKCSINIKIKKMLCEQYWTNFLKG